MNTVESIGVNFSKKNNVYTVVRISDVYNLKTIKIPKKPLIYAFIGGMWYSKDSFSFKQDISLPYPFTSYFTTKIPDKKYKNLLFRSLYYVKMPIVVLQFEDECVCIEFDSFINIKEDEFFPFICLDENSDEYIISFYLFNDFFVVKKDSAWLGFGKKRKVSLNLDEGDFFNFSTNISCFGSWTDAVESFVKKRVVNNVDLKFSNDVFYKGKQALFRSYDHLLGSFIQLPWRDTSGFALVNFSYSLIAYEAVRLHYFSKWFKKFGDKQFKVWSDGLKNIFLDSKIYKTDLKKGDGLVWYNMSNKTKDGLEGYFYMDCGYGGYPGGQGTIAFHLLRYLNLCKDDKLEGLVRMSLDYLLSTQNENGSWPMAIKQEGFIRFRSEVLENYETWGGTGECVRALIEGYKRFNDSSMKSAALNGLKYLEDGFPICYNGLRDIGINEAEAFSAVSIIDAFLDGFELTKDKKFLKFANIYGLYILPWIYFYDTKNLKLKFGFHPISYSITPRISPYESVWVVSTYLRLYKLSKNKMWELLAKLVFNEALKWVSDHGGLCEGVFPYYLNELKPLPMEQTFATTELMNASLNFSDIKSARIKDGFASFDDKFSFKDEGSFFRIFFDGVEIFRFNAIDCKIEFLKDVNLNDFGISFRFPDAYSMGSRFSRFFKSNLRRGRLKFILSVFEIKHFLWGMKAPKLKKCFNIASLGRYVKDWGFSFNSGVVSGFWQSKLHRIEYTISFLKKGDEFYISFNPLFVKVLAYDLPIRSVFIPIIGSKYVKKDVDKLYFDGFVFMGSYGRVGLIDDNTFVDQMIKTNWTHGGIYKGGFDIVLSLKN